ncbi:HPr family phosphocarrier protein, partial [Vibrio harveyi]
MKSFSFSCELPNGVHARPASHVEAVCNGFDSSITWQNQRTGMSGNAKSVLSLISTDTLLGDECLITIEGQDEDSALTQLKQFITNEFPHCDAPLATTTQEDENLAPLPRNFSNLNVAHIRGRSVSEGFGQGVLTAMGAINFDAFTDLPPAKSLNEERSQLNSGLEAVVKSLTIQLNSSEHTEGEVLKAHLSIAKDEEFRQTIASNLVEGRSSADAIIATAKHFGEVMKNSSSAYMRERELDIRDVCYQLLQSIYGDERFGSQNKLTQPTVCLADDLTPSQFLELDKSLLKGLILSHGGNTSHTVILARSFAIPTIVGVEGSRLTDLLDEEVVVDG